MEIEAKPVTKTTKEQFYGRQDLWQKAKAEAISEAVEMLREAKPFNKILDKLAERRRAVAYAQNSEDKENFGEKRLDWRQLTRNKLTKPEDFISRQIEIFGRFDFTEVEEQQRKRGEELATLANNGITPMIDVYLRGAEECYSAFYERSFDAKDFKECFIDGENDEAGAIRMKFGVDELPTDNLKGYQSLGTLGEGRDHLGLTKSLFFENKARQFFKKREVEEEVKSDWSSNDLVGVWIHTAPESIPMILEYAAARHDALMRNEPDDDNNGDPRVRLLAEIAWWLFHAMPYVRGSAAIVEWYIAAVVQCCGLKLPGDLVSGTDIAAFHMSKAEFVKRFGEFFQPAEQVKSTGEVGPAETKCCIVQ